MTNEIEDGDGDQFIIQTPNGSFDVFNLISGDPLPTPLEEVEVIAQSTDDTFLSATTLPTVGELNSMIASNADNRLGLRTGSSNCADFTITTFSNSAEPVPTLNEWGLMILALALAGERDAREQETVRVGEALGDRPAPPNIIYVGALQLLDPQRLRAEITPNLASLELSMAIFRSIYNTFPGTTRTHRAINTGGRTATWGNILDYSAKDYAGPLMPRVLNQHHYKTALISAGFLDFEGIGEFYRGIGYEGPFPGNNDWGKYGNVLHYNDHIIGRLVEALRRRERLDNTVIVISGDHGQAFGRRHARNFAHRNFLYEENIRNFLIVLDFARIAGPLIVDRTGFIGDIADYSASCRCPGRQRSGTKSFWP